MRRPPSIISFLLSAAAVALSAAPTGAQELVYVLPELETATYRLVDQTEMSLESPLGVMEIGGSSTWSYGLTFASEGEGVRVTAELGLFEGSLTNSMTGSMSLSQAQAGAAATFELVLGRSGLAEVVGASRRYDGDLPILVDPEAVMFPRLPAGDASSGDTWVDTVTTVVGEGGERVVVYTYTVEGEVDHNGRAHLRVAVSGASELTLADGGMAMNLSGTETGHFLWDMERGLVGSSEMSRTEEGGTPTPDGSGVQITFTATTQLVLEN